MSGLKMIDGSIHRQQLCVVCLATAAARTDRSLDMVPESALSKRIIERLELKDDRVSDLHVWQVGPGHSAVIASLVTHEPEDPSVYKARLNGLHGLSHVTIEVHTCPGTH
jgi:Co/Zn/Cd efflux system component